MHAYTSLWHLNVKKKRFFETTIIRFWSVASANRIILLKWERMKPRIDFRVFQHEHIAQIFPFCIWCHIRGDRKQVFFCCSFPFGFCFNICGRFLLNNLTLVEKKLLQWAFFLAINHKLWKSFSATSSKWTTFSFLVEISTFAKFETSFRICSC